MKVNNVSVRRVESYGHYQNVSFEYSANVEDDESPFEVKEALLKMVQQSIDEFAKSEKSHINDIQYAELNEKRSVARQAAEIEEDIKRLASKYENCKDFMENLGIDTTNVIGFDCEDDLPF